jgi:hypothetical protein
LLNGFRLAAYWTTVDETRCIVKPYAARAGFVPQTLVFALKFQNLDLACRGFSFSA